MVMTVVLIHCWDKEDYSFGGKRFSRYNREYYWLQLWGQTGIRRGTPSNDL